MGEALPNSEIFRRLADRMGFEEPYLYESDEAIIRDALSSGHPWLDGVTFERLVTDGWAKLNLPDPWLPHAEGGSPTASGRFEFASDAAAVLGLDPIPGYVAARESPAGDRDLAARYPLALMTSKPAVHFLNSSYSGSPRHLAAEGEPLLDIHPADAEPREISGQPGARVQRSGRGSDASQSRGPCPRRPRRDAVRLVGISEPRWNGGQHPDRGWPQRSRRRRRLPRHPGRSRAGTGAHRPRQRDTLTRETVAWRSADQAPPCASAISRSRTRSPSARRPLCSYSLVIQGRRPRMAAAVSSAKARSTYRSST